MPLEPHRVVGVEGVGQPRCIAPPGARHCPLEPEAVGGEPVRHSPEPGAHGLRVPIEGLELLEEPRVVGAVGVIVEYRRPAGCTELPRAAEVQQPWVQ